MKNSDFNNWHPMPRYGLAAALKELGVAPETLSSEEQLYELSEKAIRRGLSSFMLAPQPASIPGYVIYRYLPSDKIDPGSKSGQIAAKGYYAGPHITTSNNSADIVKEAKSLIDILPKKEDKTYELKRSFAPMIAKLNAGKLSMSNPKVNLLHAAFTAVAALTERKPAAYRDGNVGLFPDLPYYDPETSKYRVFSLT